MKATWRLNLEVLAYQREEDCLKDLQEAEVKLKHTLSAERNIAHWIFSRPTVTFLCLVSSNQDFLTNKYFTRGEPLELPDTLKYLETLFVGTLFYSFCDGYQIPVEKVFESLEARYGNR